MNTANKKGGQLFSLSAPSVFYLPDSFTHIIYR